MTEVLRRSCGVEEKRVGIAHGAMNYDMKAMHCDEAVKPDHQAVMASGLAFSPRESGRRDLFSTVFSMMPAATSAGPSLRSG
jgi:hypothetical protein